MLEKFSSDKINATKNSLFHFRFRPAFIKVCIFCLKAWTI